MRDVLVLLALGVARASNSDLIEGLPGAPVAQCWKSFSGYLEVEAGKKKLFHWYHEATEDPASKPVVLWLNGGPGCSSLGGMFTELGPYVLDADMGMSLNPYSWNKVANVLFMEQPAGVGFSYPNATIDDATTALDTYEGLLQFFAAHPELDGRPFYVAGESYGGHYVPNTAKAVEDGNAALAEGAAGRINLKGFMVGNGYCDWHLDFNANVANGRYHALTSEKDFRAAEAACGGDYARCFWPRDDVECPEACDAAVQKSTSTKTSASTRARAASRRRPSSSRRSAGRTVGRPTRTSAPRRSHRSSLPASTPSSRSTSTTLKSSVRSASARRRSPAASGPIAAS